MDVDLGHLSKPCVCGEEHSVVADQIYIESGAVSRLFDILNQFQNPIFICDSNTRAAAEPFLEEEFKDYLVIELNPEGLRADDAGIEKVMTQLEACDRGLSSVSVDVLVAIGTGTIHDLTRYASMEYEIPFVSIPTAASMDGFVSGIASLCRNGMKRSIPSVAPEWMLADTDIFASAPSSLTAAGVADILSKSIALADWRIARLVGDEYFCERAYDLVEQAIDEVKRHFDRIVLQEPEAMEHLMYALTLAGISMQMLANSRAASGAEHLCGHLWDLAMINPPLQVLHGDLISVASLIVADEYHKIRRAIRKGNVSIRGESARGIEYALLENHVPSEEWLELILTENAENPLEEIDLVDLEEDLDEIAEILDDVPKAEGLAAMYEHAGCKRTLGDIGLSEDIRELTLQLAPYVRNRLTLLRISKLFEIAE